MKTLVLGIDASNIRRGGGLTHLSELLRSINPSDYGISRVIVWSGRKTLDELPSRDWLLKVNPKALNHSLFFRVLWQVFRLDREVYKSRCDLLFVPGGSYIGMFSPVVSMSQNLLPFEMGDLGQIESKAQYFKMFLLRLSQTYTFKRSQGLIFLTEYAKQKVLKVTGQIECDQVIIPHGLNSRFIGKKKIQLPLSSYSAKNPMRLIYVSNIDAYKHQSEVLKACGILIDKGYPIELTFIGPGSIRAVNDLNVQISKLNTTKKWSQYLGVFKYLDLPDAYEKADIGIFASSCETFGIILLEKMASGLPIAAANRSCIPELLGKGAIFFDPQNPSSISDAIEQYLLSDTLRTEKIKISHDLAIKYSWEKSSDMTFKFFKKIALAGKE